MQRDKNHLSLAGSAILFVTMVATAGLANAASPTQNVNVVNTPLPVQGTVRNGDEPARQPFQATCAIFGPAESCSLLPAVPLGKRLVIEMVGASFSGLLHSDIETGHMTINSFPVLGTFGHFGGDFVASKQVRLYADPGTTVQVSFSGITVGGGGGGVVISGYLVDVP